MLWSPTLTQVHDVGEVLGSALGALGAGERFERFELGQLPLVARMHMGHRSMRPHLMLVH